MFILFWIIFCFCFSLLSFLRLSIVPLLFVVYLFFVFYLFLFSLLFIYRLRLHVPSTFLFLALYIFNTAPLSFTAPFVLSCWHRHLSSRDMTIKIFLIYWLLAFNLKFWSTHSCWYRGWRLRFLGHDWLPSNPASILKETNFPF